MSRITGSRVGYLAALGAGILLGVAAVGTAVASSNAPAKVVTHHFALAASAFAPDSLGDTTKTFSINWDPVSLSNDSSRCFNAGLALPANATLKSVTFYFTKGTDSMALELNRQNLIKHTYAILARAVTKTTTGMAVYSSVTVPIARGKAAVDMGRYGYSAGVCPSGNTQFSGLIITYTAPAG
jgi:hypothetical protein